MKELLLFIQKYYYWFIFLLLEIVSAVLLFQFNSYQGYVYFTSANAVSGYAYEVQSRIVSYFSLSDVNRELTAENLRLSQEVAELRKEQEARDTVKMAQSISNTLQTYPSIPAVVVNLSLNRQNNFLTINKGASDGVKPEMGVVGGNGLVGVVYQTTAHYSLVLPLLNTDSNISCRIRGKGYFGNLRWDAQDSRYAMLEDVPRHAQFKKGDLVETSGYSEVFPAGIFVGRIDAIYDSSDGQAFQLKIRLSTDFGKLRNVHVLLFQPDLELKTIQDEVRRVNRKEEK